MIDVVRNFLKHDCLEDSAKYLYSYLPAHIRYPKSFWYWYSLLEEAENWDTNRIREYQMEQIKGILRFSYKNVNYFNKKFDELGIDINKIQDFNDYEAAIPFSDRHLFMENLGELISCKVDLNRQTKIHTSGSTGNPLVFYQDKESFYAELAFTYHVWKRAGFKPADRRVQIRGDILDKDRPYEYYGMQRSIRLSPGNINKETAIYYLRKIKRYKSIYIHGYPSAISILAKVIKEYGLSIPFKTKAVFCSSEPTYAWQRKIIEEVFDSKVYCLYGNTEQVAIASDCDYKNYHFEPLYSYVEIDSNNEIVGTSFLNYINPFIRHKTKDIVHKVIYNCECKHKGLCVDYIEGRQGDYLLSLDNKLISPTEFTFAFVGIETIKNSKIEQGPNKEMLIQYSLYENAEQKQIAKDLENLRKNINIIMNGDVNLIFERTKVILTQKNGKIRWIKSSLTNDLNDTRI